MKKIIVFVAAVCCGLGLCSCQYDVEPKETQQTSEIKVTARPTESTADLVSSLAKDFSTDIDSGYGKRLENAWKANKDNVEISAMYHYYNARFYEDINQISNAKNEMKNISPDYSGVMSSEIVKYGISLFGSKDNWGQGNGQKQEHIKNISDSKRKEIKNWIQTQYDYYDKIEGRYCGDKYTKKIFNDAAKKFGFTYEEIYNIWCDLPI